MNLISKNIQFKMFKSIFENILQNRLMLKIDTLINSRIAQNIFIWVCLFFIIMAVITTSNSKMETSFFALLFILVPTYVNNSFILPFLLKKKKILFAILFMFNCIISAIVTGLLMSFFTKNVIKPIQFLNLCAMILIATFFGATLKLARDSFSIQQQKREAELKLLNAQLNPHFLFNTLNNLYGLSVVKSDKLPNLMLKLSDLLRYSLYETKTSLVSLQKEISYLENYISLEKIRLENTKINFKVTGNISDKKIAPMLFIVFIENAFKHLSSENSKVDIEILSEENKLCFTCKNTVDSTKLEQKLEKGKSGIGLANAKKRLLLMYPKKHCLKIQSDSSCFSVSLELYL